MPPLHTLPAPEELRRLVDEGMSHEQIADRIYSETGHRPHRASISKALTRAGLGSSHTRYDDHIPWRISDVSLHSSYEMQMIRTWARTKKGLPVDPQQAQRLARFLERLGDQWVLTYLPERWRSPKTGQWLEPGFYRIPKLDGEEVVTARSLPGAPTSLR